FTWTRVGLPRLTKGVGTQVDFRRVPKRQAALRRHRSARRQRDGVACGVVTKKRVVGEAPLRGGDRGRKVDEVPAVARVGAARQGEPLEGPRLAGAHIHLARPIARSAIVTWVTNDRVAEPTGLARQ